MRASLADQPGGPAGPGPEGLAIALGANLPSPAGEPLATLVALRPLLEQRLLQWAGCPLRLRWSPLFRTAPVGGPAQQADYLNAVLLVEALEPAAWPQQPAAALALLAELQQLEAAFGRQRREVWGPRSLDLDLLWWGELALDQPALQLPHPRLRQRSFVLAPLAAIDLQLPIPGSPLAAGPLLAALLPQLQEAPPQRLAPQPGWPEQPPAPC